MLILKGQILSEVLTVKTLGILLGEGVSKARALVTTLPLGSQ